MNRIVKNSLFNVLRVVVLIPLFFVLIPYTISKIGLEGYGLWALTGTITSYEFFVDFGLTTALIRFVAREIARNDSRAISEYAATAIVVFFSVLTVMVACVVLLREFIVVHILGIHSGLDLAQFLVVVAAAASFINMMSGIFKSMIDGAQRMDVSNSILVFEVVLSACGTFFFLNGGFGLKGLGYNLLIVSIISLIANIGFSKKVLPHYVLNPLLFSKQRFKEMFSYSVNLQLTSLTRFWIEPLNKLLIARFLSLAYVGYYEIGSRFNTRISAMIHSSLTPIFPATAEIFETHGIEKVELLRVKSLKYIFGISTFLYGTVFIAAPGFVALWLGGDMKVVSRVIQILSVGSYVVSLNIPAYTILNGLGYAQDTLKIEVQRSIVHAISIVALVWVFGFFGFCAAFTVSIFYNYYITNHYYKKRVGHAIHLFEYLSNWKTDIAIASLLVIAYVFVHFFGLASYFGLSLIHI